MGDSILVVGEGQLTQTTVGRVTARGSTQRRGDGTEEEHGRKMTPCPLLKSSNRGLLDKICQVINNKR